MRILEVSEYLKEPEGSEESEGSEEFEDSEESEDSEEPEYLQETTVNAVREYYKFLSQMYLDPSEVVEPPAEGWFAVDDMEGLGKTKKVISLLARLPYIDSKGKYESYAQAAPWSYWADWHSLARPFIEGRASEGYLEFLKGHTEDYGITENVPSHVFGLTIGPIDDAKFLLDTEHGLVHWYECQFPYLSPSGVYMPSIEPVTDIDYDNWPEKEIEWREEGMSWKIVDFFEMLKEEFRKLNFVPISSRVVKDVFNGDFHDNALKMLSQIKNIYHEHGWPDLERYRKAECLAAIKNLVKEQYPDVVEIYFGE